MITNVKLVNRIHFRAMALKFKRHQILYLRELLLTLELQLRFKTCHD